MDDLAIFCKSYQNDLERCAQLVETIREHNRDGVPLYLSVPRAERAAFFDRIGGDSVQYVSDEELVGRSIGQSWLNQQLVKLRFARCGAASSYLWIDSDFLVLRDFAQSEFFAYPSVPYTVMIEMRRDPFNERALGIPPEDTEYKRAIDGMRAASVRVRDWFGRAGPLYYFGAPAIWSSQVVLALEELLTERGWSFDGMLQLAPYEMTWYGEFLLRHRTIPVVPRASLAICFTRQEQYDRFVAAGFSLEEFASVGYLAVNFAAKWMHVPPLAGFAPVRRSVR